MELDFVDILELVFFGTIIFIPLALPKYIIEIIDEQTDIDLPVPTIRFLLTIVIVVFWLILGSIIILWKITIPIFLLVISAYIIRHYLEKYKIDIQFKKKEEQND